VLDLTAAMSVAIGKCSEDKDVNIILSAMNRLHAALVVAFVTEDGLKEASSTEAIGLIKNIEHISGKNLWENG